ncbi:uncharacterized protein LOC130754744 [Actinidia eriantha]|uniref:uncharacterized protein LOC130754744 n=1 Tax=Actinidia eriantha TaxID=165200 RepID=UPI0025868EF7|nr:uncharacterized protein LOC130754744 [Actinidia eriantha]
MKDYDISINYHPGKVNVEADALSRKAIGELNALITEQGCLHKEMVELELEVIMDKGHKSKWAIHPGMMKMYQDLKKMYWWMGMKWDIREYVSKCLQCQRIRRYAKSQQDYFNHCQYRSGNGRTSQWITLSDFLVR